MVRKPREPAGQSQPTSTSQFFSASSVWGASTRSRIQMGMIPPCEQSFGTPQRSTATRKSGGELSTAGSTSTIGADPRLPRPPTAPERLQALRNNVAGSYS